MLKPSPRIAVNVPPGSRPDGATAPDSKPRTRLPKAERRISRRLTVAYLTALFLIALLATTSHFLIAHVINAQRDAATIINVAGRQRMLSQRIGLLAMDLHDGKEASRAPLQAAIDLMLRSENALTEGGDLGIKHPLSPAVRPFYFAGAAALDPATRAFITQAQIFAGNDDGVLREAAYKGLETAAHFTLLPSLIQAVTLLQDEANRRIAFLSNAENVIFAALLGTLGLEALFIFRPMTRRARADATRLYELATRDALTGLTNRRFFMDLAGREWLAARRTNMPLAAVIFDLDHFKRINDSFGHATGDAVLRRFADITSAAARGSDVMSRIGGEEFALLLPQTTLSGALMVAERMRLAIAQAPPGDLPAITVSAGIGVFVQGDSSFDDILLRADRALYQAKETGRNRVMPQPDTPAENSGGRDRD